MEFHYQVRSDSSHTAWMAFDVRDLARALDLSLTHSGVLGIIQAALERYGPPLEQIVDMLIDWYEGETE
nr:hypothetical protein [Anaerolineae bacterium]